MKRGIPMSHVQVLRADGSLIPQVGLTVCSPACIFYADCSNFRNREICQGFRLSQNGVSENRILSILRSGHKTYIENAVNRLPNFKPQEQEVIIRDVQRYLHFDDEDFPTQTETFAALEQRLSIIETKVSADKRTTQPTKRVVHKLTRSFDPNDDRETIELKPIEGTENYPEICTKDCPHTQCSSWGVPSMQGQPCRNRVAPNRSLMTERSLNPNLRR